MPEEPKVIWEVKECPICHGSETLAQIADKPLKEAGRVPKEKFSSLFQDKVALTNPMLGLSVEMLIVHSDICKCGFQYYTRGERTVGIVKMIGAQKAR